MKNTLLIGALLLMIGQANAEAGVLDEAMNEALEEALRSADHETRDNYTACVKEMIEGDDDEEQCINLELGDIYN